MVKKTKKGPTYYYPSPNDVGWNAEICAILPYLSGKGCDVGCGDRSIFKSDVRVDIDKKRHPDYVCSAEVLPFAAAKFDYVYALHVLEHMKRPWLALNEWARVVKKDGVVAVVMPDVRYCKAAKFAQAHLAENDPMRHFSEFTADGFMEWWKEQKGLPLELIDAGVAWEGWSFYAIFKKK